MLLTSYQFLIFILICFVLYYLIPKRCQWGMLLIASYVFYFMAGAAYPLILFATSFLTYVTAILVENQTRKEKAYLDAHRELSRAERKAYRAGAAKKKKGFMLLGLLACLAILGVFKYGDFVIDNVNLVLWQIGSSRELGYLDLLMPMGISFYTFQSLGYLLDVYRERVDAQRNLPKHMLFVSFFPQLIQGPISRYSDLAKTLCGKHRFDWRNVRFGLERILWGYFKKLVIADTILNAVTTIVSDAEYYSGAWVLVGIIFYGIELYADFTGGIDITIGIAQVLGITVQENFIRPYFSKNITEYWRRWHISMGTWFRDYIFYPMSISMFMNRLTKFCKKHFGKGVSRRVPVYLATMVTWFATGIWHGASWNFVTWGVLNGVVILISGEFDPLYERFHKAHPRLVASAGYRAFQILRTFLLMGCLRMLDCYEDVAVTFRAFISMFRDFSIRALTLDEFLAMDVTVPQYIIVFAGTLLMFAVSMVQRKGSVREQIAAKPYVVRYVLFVALFLAVILFGSYGFGFDETQFIYNQF